MTFQQLMSFGYYPREIAVVPHTSFAMEKKGKNGETEKHPYELPLLTPPS